MTCMRLFEWAIREAMAARMRAPLASSPPARTMQTIADVYERELDRTVNVITALIPPVIIVLIAIVVGFVVYSILSAVFEMTHSLQVRPQ